MDCTEVRDRLIALDDGELGASERLQVERHLAGCAGCDRHRSRLRASAPRRPPAAPRAVLDRLAEDRVDRHD
ncbi:MAG: zf-HC2 domain-containing protein, partial [Myxococcota bacterium]